MRWERTITAIEAHAEGEIGRVITGGVLNIPGPSLLEKLSYLNGPGDDLRKFCLFEPRGCAQMTANLLLPPTDPRADAAFIPMQADGSHAMSGSNAICVTTVLLETGILGQSEPHTRVVLETAAGLVIANARCRSGKVEAVTLEFFPSFVEHLSHPLEVPGLGTLMVDVAFGGVYYVLPNARDLGVRIEPGSAQDMVAMSHKIKGAAQEQISVAHPVIQDFREIEFVMYCDRDPGRKESFVNGTVMPPGRMDRSPCGTGTAARLAVLLERGDVHIGQDVDMHSTIGSRFRAKIDRQTEIGGRRAIIPQITGRAWIIGIHQLGADPDDPFRAGFTVADTWGNGINHQIPQP
ncbi:MAG: proline racemase family protein [Pseudomonadota bacterium]